MTARSPSILVVEDERDLADLYAAWLEDDCEVYTAYDGQEALEMLAPEIDVVLLDRRMPGLSGDEVLEEIRGEGYDCRVAMVTAVEPDFDIIDMGFDDYLEKPIAREDIEATVERLVTRNTYNDKLDEFATLVSKKIALETEKPEEELATHDEFQRLESEIEAIRSDIDPMVQRFEDDDVAAVLRDIPATST